MQKSNCLTEMYNKILTELGEVDWRDKVVTHITPKKHKLSRVKISSLPPEEQEKYNPNRFKPIKNLQQSSGGAIDPVEITNIKTVDMYVATKDVEYITNLPPKQLILATTKSEYAVKYFNEELISVKISNLPVIAIKKYVSGDFEYVDDSDLKIVDVEDESEDELFELVKFSDYSLFLIELSPFLQYVKINVEGEEVANKNFTKLNTLK